MSFSDELSELIRVRADSGSFSGVVALEEKGDRIFEEAHGFAHRGWRVPNTIDTRFRVASIGKMSTAVGVLQLVGAGQIDFNASIVQLLEFTDTRISQEVAIEHLLSHTSGISDWVDEESLTDEIWETMWQETPIYEIRRLEDYLPFFAFDAPISSPGAKYRYCNAGYILLGMLIEKVTGQSYFTVIEERVFEVAGMRDSGFVSLDSEGPSLAEGYFQDSAGEWKKNIFKTTPDAGPDGGAISTAGDLIRFLKALRKGELLGREMTQRMLEPSVPWGDGSVGFKGYSWGYGNGFMFNSREDGSVVRYGHTGEEVGVSGRMYHYPERDLDLVVLGNVSECTGDLCWEIHDRIVSHYEI